MQDRRYSGLFPNYAAWLLCAALWLSWMAAAGAQMRTGPEMKDFDAVFRVKTGKRVYPYTVQYIACSAPGGILFPGEQPEIGFQIVNHLDRPLRAEGRVEVIAWGTRGIPGDIWLPEVFKVAEVQSLPFQADIPAGGFQNVTLRPTIPETKGAYALVVDLGEHGRQFLASLVRTFRPDPRRLQYPKFSLDYLPDEVLQRLGVQAIRLGVEWWLPDDRDGERRMAELDRQLRTLQEHNITAMLMVGASPVPQPLGRDRPHLNADGVMMATKSDMAWLPQYDGAFRQWVARIAARYGWPKGPVTAFNLWNEPWEGLSISGWGADMLRYREIFRAMAQGVEQARREAKVKVLLAGADSGSNTFDKFLADGTTGYLKWLDAVTIHYQGMASPANIRLFRERKGPYGRVKVWDTESWVANTDDRVAAVVAANRAAGYDRSMGIFGGNLATGRDDREREVFTAPGRKERITAPVTAWPAAAAVGAMQQFLGERPFHALLFRNGLPWVMVFDGLPPAGATSGDEPAGGPLRHPDDGTVVVCGDLGEAFGANNVLFRTVRGYAALQRQAALRRRLAALPSSAPASGRAALQAELDRPAVRTGMLTLPADPAYRLYDFYGNPVPPLAGRIVVPLDHRGFFLRPDGAPGSFARLLAALRRADIRGFEPVEMIPRDMTAPVESRPALRVRITNVLNRPITGTLRATLNGLRVQAPAGPLALAANETKTLVLKVLGGRARPDNTYPLALTFDAGRDGTAAHEEDMHVNLIARRTVKVDGDLSDWKGVLPQTVRSAKAAGSTLEESAWFPFAKFRRGVRGGFATGYLAYDRRCFYFAAKIADSTPDAGTVRFATRDDASYFYPPVAYQADADATLQYRLTQAGAADGDASSLQRPDGAGRLRACWENTDINNSYAFDLRLPPDRRTQVALYLGPWEVQEGVGVQVFVTDRANGRVLHEQRMERLWKGAYAVYRLSGDVRIRVKCPAWWYTAKTCGLFFDPAPDTPASAGATAQFVKNDFDTQGNWRGVYGAAGYALAGRPFRLPPGVSLAMPVERKMQAFRWPQDVRRFSYRRWPDLPAGNGSVTYDNVQIAFNVLPPERKTTIPVLPGTMPGFLNYQDTDYEFALNRVAARYGGGTEIWRLLVPGMPRKHFYPRQPKSRYDGPAQGGALVVTHEGGTRIVECALPWSEIPAVRQAMQAGRPVKFSFLVNDPGGAGVMDLARGRGVAKANFYSFHVDWSEHWANELEFGFERPRR